MFVLRMNGKKVLQISKIQFTLDKVRSGEFVVKRLNLIKMEMMK